MKEQRLQQGQEVRGGLSHQEDHEHPTGDKRNISFTMLGHFSYVLYE